jgi:N-acetylglutamate synthase-like GNAT family acetyltransferase
VALEADDVNPVRVRPAASRDVPAMTRVINAAYRVEDFFKAGDRTDEHAIAALLAADAFLIVEDERGMCGCVYVQQSGDRGYFGMLAVDPARQGEGHGRRLVEAAERHCRALGCTRMDLSIVNLRTELPPFYRKLGYEEVGTAPFPEPAQVTRPCHMIKMAKPL